jgi:hypothetical protein
MIRYLIPALALLLMAVGLAPAHAYPVAEWQCGDITVNISSPAGIGGPEETTVTLTGPHVPCSRTEPSYAA